MDNSEIAKLTERIEGLRDDMTEVKLLLSESIKSGTEHRQELDRRVTTLEADAKHSNTSDIKAEIAVLKAEMHNRPTFKQFLVGAGLVMIPVVGEIIVGIVVLT